MAAYWKNYHTPSTVAEAVALLARYSGQAQVVGGGTDLLEIAGHAQIDGEALVSIEPEDGVYDGASPFTILTADTLSGNFVSPQEFCGLDVGLAAIGSSIQLTLTDLGGSPFANAKCAVTPNQKAVTRSLDEIYYGSGETALVDLYDTARTLSPSQAQSALDSMSGEAFAAFSTTRLANGARLVRTLSQRLRDSSAESSAAGPAGRLGAPSSRPDAHAVTARRLAATATPECRDDVEQGASAVAGPAAGEGREQWGQSQTGPAHRGARHPRRRPPRPGHRRHRWRRRLGDIGERAGSRCLGRGPTPREPRPLRRRRADRGHPARG